MADLVKDRILELSLYLMQGLPVDACNWKAVPDALHEDALLKAKCRIRTDRRPVFCCC